MVKNKGAVLLDRTRVADKSASIHILVTNGEVTDRVGEGN